jgi:hypothetical protein
MFTITRSTRLYLHGNWYILLKLHVLEAIPFLLLEEEQGMGFQSIGGGFPDLLSVIQEVDLDALDLLLDDLLALRDLELQRKTRGGLLEERKKDRKTAEKTFSFCMNQPAGLLEEAVCSSAWMRPFGLEAERERKSKSNGSFF